MNATVPPSAIESIAAPVRAVAARCDTPTLVTLTGTGGAVTGRPEVIPGGPFTADTMPATLAGMARLITRYLSMFPGDVIGYAAILPGERVAFAADQAGRTHHIQLPGVPNEPLRADRWDAICDGLTTMIHAAR